MPLPTEHARHVPANAAHAPLHVFVNAVNVVGFGASAVVRHLLCELSRAPGLGLTAAVPDLPMYRSLDIGDNVRIRFWPRAAGALNNFARLRQLHRDLPRAVLEARPDVCLTLGDVGPIRLACPQITFVHLAHLAYPPDYFAGHDAWSPLKRRYLEWHFRRMVRHGARVIVQTPLMAARIGARYDIDTGTVYCIPQPAPLMPLGPAEVVSGLPAIERVKRPLRLLFIAALVAQRITRSCPRSSVSCGRAA